MKRFLYKVLLEFLKLLVLVKRFFVVLWQYLSPRFSRVLSVVLRLAFFGVFKYYVGVRRRIEGQFSNTEEKIYAFSSQRIFASILIAALVMVVALPHTRFWVRPAYSAVGSESMLLAVLGTSDEEGESIDEQLFVETKDTAPATVSGTDPFAYGVQVEPVGEDHDAGIDEFVGLSEGGSSIEAPFLMPGAEVTPSRRKISTYIVQGGDTLSSIAEKFEIDQKTVMSENNLTSRSYIRPGDVLSILPVTGASHVVKRGDTLSSIVKDYGVDDVEKLIVFNRLANASDIVVGEKLVIPGGVRKAPPAPVATKRPAASNTSLLRPFSPPTNPSSAGLSIKSPIYAPASFLNIAPPSPSKYASTNGMVWPTSGHVVTQYFHARHHGLDIDGHYDSPIYAADSGVVKIAGWRTNGYGLSIDIDHGNGMITRYGHASRLYVSVGERVVKGQVIAMVGTTGRSTGTHLHFEIMVNGAKANPFRYVR